MNVCEAAGRHVHQLGTAGCVCGFIPADGSPVPKCSGCAKGAIRPGCPVRDPQARRES